MAHDPTRAQHPTPSPDWRSRYRAEDPAGVAAALQAQYRRDREAFYDQFRVMLDRSLRPDEMWFGGVHIVNIDTDE
jgi:hypothetical protein